MVATVGTSTSANAVIYGFQKKCFYANGRWWAWYYNGTNFGWETSLDGIDWTGAFTSYGAYSGWRLDIWYDEANNKICLARCQGSTANVYYNQGTANSDGTITGDFGSHVFSSATEVQITTDAGYDVKVCKDSNGYPWVSYLQSTTGYPLRVVQATATNGSSWGSPTTLWTPASGSSDIIIVPLTSGKMLAIKNVTGSVLQSRLYNGSSWETAVDASTYTSDAPNHFDAVADGDDVHLVFCKVTSFDIVYVKYVYGTGWGSEETVESATVSQCHPVISFKSTDKVRVFYLLSQTTIKYRDRDNGSWQTAVTISSSESTMTCVCSSYKAFSSKICVTWKSGAASPYDVKFEGYILAIVKEVTDSISLAESILRDKTLTVSDSVASLDSLLAHKTLQITDTITVLETILRDKTFTVSDSVGLSEIITVITGGIIKEVLDGIGLSDQVTINKSLIIQETISMLDQIFRHKPSITITDVIALAEIIAASKLLTITDAVSIADVVYTMKTLPIYDQIAITDQVSTPTRILQALDAIGLSDTSYVNKTLIITDQIGLAEVVEVGKGGAQKTKLFLILGDLAIQIQG
jgi:hypothetical protein